MARYSNVSSLRFCSGKLVDNKISFIYSNIIWQNAMVQPDASAGLKTVDTIGNCHRLDFTVGVSQHMHKITNLWKFELNRSSKLRDNNERRKHPCHTKLCAFRYLISRPQVLNPRPWNQIRGKVPPSRKLWHFRGSCFSQCFIPPTSPHYSSPRKVLC